MKNKSNKTMRAVAIDEFGGIEKIAHHAIEAPHLTLRDFHEPGELVVRHRRSGKNIRRKFKSPNRISQIMSDSCQKRRLVVMLTRQRVVPRAVSSALRCGSKMRGAVLLLPSG